MKQTRKAKTEEVPSPIFTRFVNDGPNHFDIFEIEDDREAEVPKKDKSKSSGRGTIGRRTSPRSA